MVTTTQPVKEIELQDIILSQRKTHTQAGSTCVPMYQRLDRSLPTVYSFYFFACLFLPTCLPLLNMLAPCYSVCMQMPDACVCMCIHTCICVCVWMYVSVSQRHVHDAA